MEEALVDDKDPPSNQENVGIEENVNQNIESREQSNTKVEDKEKEKIPTEEIEDNIETVVDETPVRRRSFDEPPPPVQEELAPIELTKEELDNLIPAKEVEDETIQKINPPEETTNDVSALGDHNSLTSGSLDDPFLLVGKKLNSTDTSLNSNWRQDSLQYSLSSKGTMNNSLAMNSQLPPPEIETVEDDSLFHDVDNDMNDSILGPVVKETNRSTVENAGEMLSKEMNQDAEDKVAKVEVTNPQPTPLEAAENGEEKNEDINPEIKVSAREEGNDPAISKVPIKKFSFREKKRLPKSNPALKTESEDRTELVPAEDEKPATNVLSVEEMVKQAEMVALQDKKQREEKAQQKKLKRHSEKEQKEGDDPKKGPIKKDTEGEEASDPSKRSQRRRSKEKVEDQEHPDNKVKKSARRRSKDKTEISPPPGEGHSEADHPNNDPKASRKSLKQKPSLIGKKASQPKPTDDALHLPEIPSARRHQDHEKGTAVGDDASITSNNPVNGKRKVHPSKFPAILRKQVKATQDPFDLETSADDSSLDTNHRHPRARKLPFSSPSERRNNPHSDHHSDSSAVKRKKVKPLYLRLAAKAQQLRLEEERAKHEEYVKMRKLRYKQPTREEIREHMKQFNELLKLKSEEFKQNHLAQMRQLKQSRSNATKSSHHLSHETDEGDENHSIITSNNPWGEGELALSPKKPRQSKQENHHNHPQSHRSVIEQPHHNHHHNHQPQQPSEKGEEELNTVNSIKDFLITDENNNNSNNNNEHEVLSNAKELSGLSSFLPVTTPSPVQKTLESPNNNINSSNNNNNPPVVEPIFTPRPLSPGKNLPFEEVASLLESDWLGKMKV